MVLPSVTTSATTSLPPMTLYSPWKCCVSFVMFSNLLPCQRVPQEAVAQRSGEGRLLVVRGRRVAAFGVFEEPHVLDALRLHPRGHLPCLDGSDPEDGRADAVAGHRGQIGKHTSELQSRFDLVCRLLLEQQK